MRRHTKFEEKVRREGIIVFVRIDVLYRLALSVPRPVSIVCLSIAHSDDR